MGYKNQKWKDEYIAFLFELTNVKSKKDRQIIFKEKFPESNFSINAVSVKMSEVGACQKRKHSCNNRPLYSERTKKGYVQIKVAQPSVWWQKQRWVYIETHPYEYNDIEETDCYYFLDGDNNNFHPANIVRVKRREQTVFQQLGGVVKGNPELTKQHILQAKLKLAQFDAGEKLGLVANSGGGRIFIDERNTKARAYRKKRYAESEDYRNKNKADRKKYMEKLKSDPVRYEKYKAHRRELAKKYKEKKNDN